MFNGGYLYNTGPTNQGGGLNAYLESPSPYGLISFWYWTSSVPGPGKSRTILKMNPSKGFIGGIVKVVFRRNDPDVTPRLHIRVQSAIGETVVRFRTAPVPYGDRRYHHIILTWNVSVDPNTLPDCYLDGAPLAWDIESREGDATFTVAYKQNQNFFIGTDGALLGTTPEGPFHGILAEIFFDPIKTDFGVGVGSGGDALVYTFYDIRKSKYAFRPGNIGSDGSSVLERKPAIYLHGYYTQFYQNHGGNSAFRAVGAVSSPSADVADPSWWRFWRNTVNFFEGGASTYEFEEPTATGSNSTRASLFDPASPVMLAAFNDGEITPAIADSPTGLVSFWYNAPPSAPEGAAGITVVAAGLRYEENLPGGVRVHGFSPGLAIELQFDYATGFAITCTNVTEAYVSQFDDYAGNATWDVSFVSENPNPVKLVTGDVWHHIIAAWDTVAKTCLAFLDGQPLPLRIVSSGATPGAIPYSSGQHEFYVGQIPQGDGSIGYTKQKFSLAELYLNLANYDFVAALTPELIAKFRAGATNTAREIGVTASLPLGPDAPKPDFYLSGPPREFVHSFAKTDGTLGHRWGADGAKADTTFTMRVIGGSLALATSDPFKAKELVS